MKFATTINIAGPWQPIVQGPLVELQCVSCCSFSDEIYIVTVTLVYQPQLQTQFPNESLFSCILSAATAAT